MHTKKIILVLAIFLLTNAYSAQSHGNDADKICESISIYFKDPNLYCIYDTLISVTTTANDSCIVFAIGRLDVKGISTNYVDIFISKNLKVFRRIRRDTLLTADCVPCDDPRDFLGLCIKGNKNTKQIVINCSYFYNRHQRAGTIYRSFVFDLISAPIWVRRNIDEEYKLRKSSIGKIDGDNTSR
jgi:hypothetical protein